MCEHNDDSFDLDELENLATQPTVTAWSAQVAAKPRTFRTYGRRGSTGALPTKSTSLSRANHHYPPSRRIEEPLDCLSPTAEENEFGQITDIEDRSLPVFKPDVPKIPGRRRFTRANSLGSHNLTSSSSKPKYPVLRRSASISHSTDYSLSTTCSSSVRSSSMSSSLDSFPETNSMGAENLHPNLDPLDEFASPKRSARPLELRGRKKVRSAKNLTSMDPTTGTTTIPTPTPSLSLSSSSSFSNIARDDMSSTWVNASLGAALGSATSASECLSFPPVSGFNELEFLEIASPALSSVCSTRKRGICESPFDDMDDCQSTGSFSMSRHSSRSRLMSPPTHQMADFHLESLDTLKSASHKRAGKYSKQSTLMEIASDDGESGPESRDGMESDDEVSLEDRMKRRSPVPTFVPFEQRQKRNASLSVFPDTSTREKILHPDTADVDDVINSMTSYPDLKYLTKRMRGQREGSVCWHVALPNAWGDAQRRGFIHWITTYLGFTHRKAGAQAAYFQIPKSKGVGILKLLESSIAACKERGIGTKSPTNNAAHHFAFGVTPQHRTGKSPVGLSITTGGGLLFPENSSYLDDDLMNAMGSLGVNDNKARQQDNLAAKRSTITLDDTVEMPLHEPRLSVENHTSSTDLMAHMHGVTPIPKPGRPPRLSTSSVSTQGTVSKFNAASPFPHAQLSSMGQGSSMKCFTHEFVETPMARPLGWGSCPVDGRDWGTSEGCSEHIVHELLRRLQQTCSEAGVSTGESELLGGEPRKFSLDLELEAEAEYRETESSPDSSGKRHGGYEAGYFPEESLSESSPSSRGGFDTKMENNVEFQLGPGENDTRAIRRRQTAFAKHKRMSLFASAVNPAASIFNNRKSLFVRPSRTSALTFRPSILTKNLVSEHKFEADVKMESSPRETPSTPDWQDDTVILKSVFVFLTEADLLRSVSPVCTKWADVATEAHAELMLTSVGCTGFLSGESELDESDDDDESSYANDDAPRYLEKSWSYLTATFPWARFLAEGGFKQVFKVFNHVHRAEEAISVMDIKMLKDSGEINVVGAELAVSVMLSSLVRRGVCPNFVVTRGAFSCPFKPPAKIWGSENNKCPKGDIYLSPQVKKTPKEPKARGRYQYIRMELCDCGDAEEYIKTLPDELFDPEEARQLLFQMAFALHAAAIRFSLKHYDVKLLNYFCQRLKPTSGGDTVLRYGLGDHVFAMRLSAESGIMAKLADYGTANVDSATNGQQVTIAQFTTLENTPADFMIMGDKACQGHGHDNWGLGLCMLHLYTGHAPYEEIMEDVTCPSNLRKRLCKIWECEDEEEFSVIRGVILADVYKDEEGHILEGEPNEVLYDTFYRFLVLFGIPSLSTKLRNSKVWVAVRECLDGPTKGKTSKGKKTNDISQYTRDCRKYSIDHGSNKYITRARKALQSMDGGMELLKSLVDFDPKQRFTALDAMNSTFMEPLREVPGRVDRYNPEDDVRTFTSFSTNYD